MIIKGRINIYFNTLLMRIQLFVVIIDTCFFIIKNINNQIFY